MAELSGICNVFDQCYRVYSGGGGTVRPVHYVKLTEAEWQELSDIANPARQCGGFSDAALQNESNALRRAVARFEQIVGPVAGTENDVGGWIGNELMDRASKILFPGTSYDDLTVIQRDMIRTFQRGQQLCDDEAETIFPFILNLQGAGLLCNLYVDPKKPYAIMPDHMAVRLVTKADQEWVLDSWVHNSGELPDILPFKEWKNQTIDAMTK